MKKIDYTPHGICPIKITLEVDDNDQIQNLHFVGGCDGNLKGLSSLVKGMKVDEVKKRLDGIRCGAKSTSCPDQLCRAIDELYKNA